MFILKINANGWGFPLSHRVQTQRTYPESTEGTFFFFGKKKVHFSYLFPDI